MLDKAEELTDPYSRVRLYWSLARLNELQGKSVAALGYIRRAIALLEVTDDTLHLARAHLLCGSIMLSQGQTDAAVLHVELAEKLFGPNPEPEDRANLYTDQARLAARLGRADEAIARARAALDAAGDDYLAEKGNALWALAEGLSLTDDVDAADGAYAEATALLGAHGLRRTTSRRTARGERYSAARDARARRSRCSSARTALPQNRPAARSHTTLSSDLGRDSAARPVFPSALRCVTRATPRAP